MVGRTQVDGCDACGGLWFDADEVFRVARGGQEAVAGAEAVVEPPPAGAGMEPAEMVCPRCDSPLFDTAADPSDLHLEVNPHVDHCCECGGIWLELAALSVLVDVPLEWLREWQARLDAAVAGNAMKAAGEALCPVCQVALDERSYAHDESICIDRCTECGGTWLDHGELIAVKQVSIRQDVWGNRP